VAVPAILLKIAKKPRALAGKAVSIAAVILKMTRNAHPKPAKKADATAMAAVGNPLNSP
jgi:hypothetical protein